uniref:Poly [ADP-ribose] polymerase n=1 Tax=Crassostrea virginica TaxID=6565 RepID=A0A8B8DZB2_CRAVI|nr:poly [ADP-ribose] polymerase 8-like [Crassostrea virginica]
MTLRQQRFAEDVNSAIALCEQYGWPFTDFHQTDNSLSFAYIKNNNKQTVTISISEDYPENTFITWHENQEHSDHSNDTIKNIVMAINREMSVGGVERSDSMDTDNSCYEDCQERFVQDSDENEESEDDTDFIDDDNHLLEAGFDEVETNPVLSRDMEKLWGCYGRDVMEYRTFESIDEVDVEIKVSLASLLEKEIAEAWNLDRLQPMVIRLNLSLSQYLDSPKPPVLQVMHTSKSGIVSQLQKVLNDFISEQWNRVSNSLIKRLFDEAEQADRQITTSTHQPLDEATRTVHDRNIARLMEMGFTADQASNALMLNNGDLLLAVNYLMGNPASCMGPTVNSHDVGSSSSSSAKGHAPFHRQTSHPMAARHDKKVSRLHSVESRSQQKGADIIDLTSDGDDLTLVPASTWFGKKSKRIPSPNLGFLIQVYQYTRQRIPTLNEFCVVCDDAHVFQNGAMLKPSVCSRELCVFAFQTLGVMADAAESVATGAEVVDLLIAMTRSACASGRRDVIFSPYPTVVDPTKSTELALNPKSKDYEKVKKTLTSIPPIAELVQIEPGALKRKLDERNPLAYPLLQWVISSNRSHIVKLPEHRRLPFMRTSHQYLLLNSPPAKEKVFQDLKKQYGSTFAFHGSGIENWHSIIREGLVVGSGTKLQVNGAAHGKGIYLSPNSSTSFNYSRMYGTHRQKSKTSESGARFLDHGISMNCIALCEVITHPNLKKNSSIWVSPESDHVCTRFFFVYECGQCGEDICTQNATYMKVIQEAVNFRT